VPNILASLFLIRALQTIPAPVAFSAYGAGGMLLINVGGVAVFHEPLCAGQKAAVVIAALALVLVNT
jgi:multidrug transporter EmrE-like cation transporter